MSVVGLPSPWPCPRPRSPFRPGRRRGGSHRGRGRPRTTSMRSAVTVQPVAPGGDVPHVVRPLLAAADELLPVGGEREGVQRPAVSQPAVAEPGDGACRERLPESRPPRAGGALPARRRSPASVGPAAPGRRGSGRWPRLPRGRPQVRRRSARRRTRAICRWTPSARIATAGGTAPAPPAAAHPARTAAAARAAGTGTARATPPAAGSPARARRARNIARPRDSRPATVPSGQPSSAAASRSDRPSSSQRTTGARYLVGRPATAASIASRNSPAWVGGWESGRAISRSLARRRAARARAFRAVRRATPNSQLPTTARSARAAAFRARTTNVAWKASSASGPGPEDPAADPEHRRPVPLDKEGERGLVPAVREPAQQDPVGGGRSGRPGRPPPQMEQELAPAPRPHAPLKVARPGRHEKCRPARRIIRFFVGFGEFRPARTRAERDWMPAATYLRRPTSFLADCVRLGDGWQSNGYRPSILDRSRGHRSLAARSPLHSLRPDS